MYFEWRWKEHLCQDRYKHAHAVLHGKWKEKSGHRYRASGLQFLGGWWYMPCCRKRRGSVLSWNIGSENPDNFWSAGTRVHEGIWERQADLYNRRFLQNGLHLWILGSEHSKCGWNRRPQCLESRNSDHHDHSRNDRRYKTGHDHGGWFTVRRCRSVFKGKPGGSSIRQHSSAALFFLLWKYHEVLSGTDSRRRISACRIYQW